MTTPDPAAIHSLHRYFIWASRMRDHLIDLFEREINPFYAKLTPEQFAALKESDVSDQRWSLPLFLYMSYWFASLNAVIEGWRRLELTDVVVDGMLDKGKTARLKRYRDAVLHFQPKYVDDRVNEVFSDINTFVPWAHALHDAFSKYFFRHFKQQGLPIPDDLL